MNGEGIFIEDYLSPKNYARCFVYICPILTLVSLPLSPLEMTLVTLALSNCFSGT